MYSYKFPLDLYFQIGTGVTHSISMGLLVPSTTWRTVNELIYIIVIATMICLVHHTTFGNKHLNNSISISLSYILLIQASELRSAFGNADLIVDLMMIKDGKNLPTTYMA